MSWIKALKKDEIIERLINHRINPNWKGDRANNARKSWERYYRKFKKSELVEELADYHNYCHTVADASETNPYAW